MTAPKLREEPSWSGKSHGFGVRMEAVDGRGEAAGAWIRAISGRHATPIRPSLEKFDERARSDCCPPTPVVQRLHAGARDPNPLHRSAALAPGAGPEPGLEGSERNVRLGVSGLFLRLVL